MVSTKVPFPAVSAQLGTSAGVLYTCPAGTKGTIVKSTFTNTNAASKMVSVHIVRSGDSAAAKNLILDAQPIIAHNTYAALDLIGQMLEAGDTIEAFSDAVTSITPSGTIIETIPS